MEERAREPGRTAARVHHAEARQPIDSTSAVEPIPLAIPALTSPTIIASLQRSAGNRATSAVIRRDDPPPAGPAPLSTQLDDAIKVAKEKDDVGELKKLQQLPNPITPLQMFSLVDIILNQTWVGPFDEQFLERAWQNYGPAGRLTADDYRLWQRCEDVGAEARNVPWLAELRNSFAQKTRETATTNMNKNEQHILDEAKRLGISADGKAAPPPTQETDQLVAEQRLAADNVKRAREALAKLRQQDVGYAPPSYGARTLPPGGTPDSVEEKPARMKFDPAHRPDKPPSGDEAEPMPTWDTVMALHRDINGAIARIANANPAIYALIASGESDNLAGQDLNGVRAKISASLTGVLDNVKKTRSAVESQSLGWENLLPVHDRILQSDPIYSKGFAKQTAMGFVKDEGGNAEAANELMTVAVMALIAAVEIGSAGTATPVVAALIGLTASTTTAAMSWDDWSKLETAAKGTVSDENSVVGQEQADAALLSAMVDTAFALLDLYGVGKAARTAAGAAKVAGYEAAQQAATKLKNIATLEAGERIAVLSKAIDEQGLASVVRQSGHTAEQLVELVGKESALGKRLAEQIAAGSVGEQAMKDLAPKLAGLGKLAREEAETIARQGIETLGPKQVLQQAGGWRAMEAALGAGSPSMKRLDAWREAIIVDAEKYLASRTELAGAVLDAASESSAAREFLASRTGFAGDHLEDVLGVVITAVASAMTPGEPEPEPEFASSLSVYHIEVPTEVAPSAPPGPARKIQRAPGDGRAGGGASRTGLEGLSGSDFEMIVDQALRAGTFPQLPPMDFVVPGHYNGSGWGIDRIGLSVSPSGHIEVYHFEMKYVSAGGMPPKLGERSKGVQTGVDWTANAIEMLMSEKNAVANSTRTRLRNALSQAHGKPFTNDMVREFLRERLTHAPVAIITPSYARVGALWRQVFGMLEKGRSVVIIQPIVEGFARIRKRG